MEIALIILTNVIFIVAIYSVDFYFVSVSLQKLLIRKSKNDKINAY